MSCSLELLYAFKRELDNFITAYSPQDADAIAECNPLFFKEYLNTLTEREKLILTKFLLDSKNQKQIAQELCLSNSRIGQILRKIFRKGFWIILCRMEKSETNIRKMMSSGSMSVRLGNALLRYGFNDLSDIKENDIEQIGYARNIGMISIKELYNICLKHHLLCSSYIYEQYLSDGEKANETTI